MTKCKLGDICEIVSGSTPKTSIAEYWDGDVKWITPAELSDDTYIIMDSVRKITKLAVEKTGLRSIPKGTVILSSRAPIGKVAIAGCELYCNQGFKNLICSDVINNKYLYWFLRGNTIFLNSLGRGATFKEISKSIVSEIEINIPSIMQQKKVVENLEKLNRIISIRKQELQLLDELVRGRFVEMFGDIKTNEYGWEKCTFKDVSTKITDGEHGTVPRVDKGEGYLYFMARNITKEGEIDLSETSFVPREIHEKIYKRCNPEKDDLLLVCVGATIGKCTLVSEIMGEFSMARSVALIKPNKEMVTSNFLINLLRSEAIQNDIDHCSHAAAQAGLYTNMINSLEAFVPPMDLQIEFDMFCEQIDKSKLIVQKELDETQLLFDSLMQEYFG